MSILKKGGKMGTMGRTPGERFKNLCIFAVPGVFIFCTVVIIPFLYGGYLTFTDWEIGRASCRERVLRLV